MGRDEVCVRGKDGNVTSDVRNEREDCRNNVQWKIYKSYLSPSAFEV